MIESSREKNRNRTEPIPPSTLALLRAIPTWIDADWLFPTPGSAHTRRPRIEWPSHEELLAELETMSYTALSRKLGASDNALRNPMRAYEAGLQPGVAAIAGHLMNVQAEHYRQALHRSSDFIRAAIG